LARLRDQDPGRETFYDFAAHCPIEYETEKAAAMLDAWPLETEPIVDDLLYGNAYHLEGQARHIGRDLFRVQTVDDLAALTSGAEPAAERLWLNLEHGLYAPAAGWLRDRFPATPDPQQ